jgi:hypothetical protein
MDINKIREEFEAAYIAINSFEEEREEVLKLRPDGSYDCDWVKTGWWAWQASREAAMADAGQWQKAFVRIAGELSAIALTHADMTEDAPLQQAIDFVKVAMAEREQLRIDNKRLSALLECSQGDMRQADKIMDRDRKDAERHRWLRANNYDTGSYHHVHEFNAAAWFEHLDDAAIDAAIEDEAKSNEA